MSETHAEQEIVRIPVFGGGNAVARASATGLTMRPCQQRQMRPVHRRSRCNRELVMAPHAIPATRIFEPGRVVDGAALRAFRAVRPARLLKPGTCCVLVRKHFVEGAKRHGWTAHRRLTTSIYHLRHIDSFDERYHGRGAQPLKALVRQPA